MNPSQIAINTLTRMCGRMRIRTAQPSISDRISPSIMGWNEFLERRMRLTEKMPSCSLPS